MPTSSANYNYHSPESRNAAGISWSRYLKQVAADAPHPITTAAELAAGIPFAEMADVETICFYLKPLEFTDRKLKQAIARIQGAELCRDQFGPIIDHKMFAHHASAAELADFETVAAALQPMEYLHAELREAIERIQDAPARYAESLNSAA